MIDSTELLSALEELLSSLESSLDDEAESPVTLSLIPEIALLSLLELESAAELELALLELLSFWLAMASLICLYSLELVRTNVTVDLPPKLVMVPELDVNVT